MENHKLINAVIIEDEPKNVALLKKMLEVYCPQVNVLGNANSIDSSVKLINKCRPDLVFLDIEISGGNAFHILDFLQPVNFDIIFTTAYDNYLMQAIKYSALDYLYKPIKIEELISAVNKSANKIAKQKTFEQVQVLLQNISKTKPLSTIALPNVTGLQFIAVQNIIRCEANGAYTIIFTGDGKSYTASKTLKEYEDILPQNMFFRTHNSHLINLNFISKYHKGSGGTIEMTDKSMIPLAARRKNDFIELFSASE